MSCFVQVVMEMEMERIDQRERPLSMRLRELQFATLLYQTTSTKANSSHGVHSCSPEGMLDVCV